MKNQALFFPKDKSKKLECCLLQYLLSTLRVNAYVENIVLILHDEVSQCIFLKENEESW